MVSPDSVTDMSLSRLWETVKDREAWHASRLMGSQRVEHQRSEAGETVYKYLLFTKTK